jgi:hypothetical protein
VLLVQLVLVTVPAGEVTVLLALESETGDQQVQLKIQFETH